MEEAQRYLLHGQYIPCRLDYIYVEPIPEPLTNDSESIKEEKETNQICTRKGIRCIDDGV